VEIEGDKKFEGILLQHVAGVGGAGPAKPNDGKEANAGQERRGGQQEFHNSKSS
jgi:hypothetical protein